MINEKIKVRPKIRSLFPDFRSSGVNLLLLSQPFTKSKGEYQRPPIRNADSAATITANKLMF